MALASATYRCLRKSWLSFVRHELKQLGMSSRLPSSSACFCGKSWISYPHWPPSTYEESVEQFRSLLSSPRPPRPSLASCWLSFLSRTDWAQRQRNSACDDHSSMVRLLRENCPILSSDQDSPTQTRKWQRESVFVKLYCGINPLPTAYAPATFIVINARHIGSPSY